MSNILHHLPLPPLAPDWVPVADRELARLMEMPLSAFDEETRQSIGESEQWCQRELAPWHERRLETISLVEDGRVVLENNVTLKTSAGFSRKLLETRAHAIVIFAFTTGEALDRRVKELWAQDRYQESYVLQAYGTGLVEASRSRYGISLCSWADEQELAILSSDGPGYRDWPVEETGQLLHLLQSDSASPTETMRANESGMLHPVHSSVIVYGVTAFAAETLKMDDWVPCCECDLSPCRFRRRARTPSPESIRL
jgi:hypothetical protein